MANRFSSRLKKKLLGSENNLFSVNDPFLILKLDIQGAEFTALQGAARLLRQTLCAVYTEVLFNGLYQGGALFSEIDLYLREQGFLLHDIYKPKYHADRRIMWANALYVDSKKVTRPG